jgi:hypothetical protein
MSNLFIMECVSICLMGWIIYDINNKKRRYQIKCNLWLFFQKQQKPSGDTSGGYVQDDQLISDVMRLRQRRMSAQIKVRL